MWQLSVDKSRCVIDQIGSYEGHTARVWDSCIVPQHFSSSIVPENISSDISLACSDTKIEKSQVNEIPSCKVPLKHNESFKCSPISTHDNVSKTNDNQEDCQSIGSRNFLLVGVGEDSQICVWNIETGELQHTWRCHGNASIWKVKSLAFLH